MQIYKQLGGIKQILLRDWTAGDSYPYGNADDHAISSIKYKQAANADWYLYEFKNEDAAYDYKCN